MKVLMLPVEVSNEMKLYINLYVTVYSPEKVY